MYLVNLEKREMKEVKVLKRVPGFGYVIQDGNDILELPYEDDDYRLVEDESTALQMMYGCWFVLQ